MVAGFEDDEPLNRVSLSKLTPVVASGYPGRPSAVRLQNQIKIQKVEAARNSSQYQGNMGGTQLLETSWV